jgi:outer membrane protein assembly factor BamB
MLSENKIGDSYWESAVDVIDLYNGTYGVAGRKRHTRNKPVNAWLLKMDANGNVLSEWDEPDYVNNSGRGDQLSNLVLSEDGSTIIALGARFDLPTDYMLLNLWAFDVLTGQELWNVNHGEETAGENFATGIVNAYDGGFTFFGFIDNHRLRFIKTDDLGMIPLER